MHARARLANCPTEPSAFIPPMTTSDEAEGKECALSGAALLALAERLAVRLNEGRDRPGTLVRAERRVAPLSLPGWLQAQADVSHYYWSGRDGDFEMAGIGEADVLVPEPRTDLAGIFALMRSRLSIEWPSLRYYGGFRFCEQRSGAGRWRNFTAYRFIAPMVELVRRDQKVWLACTVRAGSPEANESALTAIRSFAAGMVSGPAPAIVPLPRLVGRTDLPDRAAWSHLVEQALEALAARELDKVVLARETAFSFDTEGPLDPISLLRRLIECSPRAYAFCFHPRPNRAFLGASPERLYYRNNVYLQSEALAGTRPRGATPEEDAALGEELLGDDKELREHRFVARMLRENFSRFCSSMSYDLAPSLLPLRRVQHLYSHFEGILKRHDCDGALIEALHPTPAVGGTPRSRAMDWIAAHEPFDRGVYAAPVGWVGFDDAEFCVGIRSGMVEDNTLALYAGAGIVPGSSAEGEWNEIENKMSSFLEAFHDDPA